MKQLIKLTGLLWLSLFASFVDAQVRYKVTQNTQTGAQIVRREYPPGSNLFPIIVGSLPSDATYGRFGGKTDIIYATEPKGQNNITQFGTGKYFSPNFMLAMSYLGDKTPDVRRSVGINGFAQWDVKSEHEGQTKTGERFLYSTENFLGAYQPASKFIFNDLQSFVNVANALVPRIGLGDWAKYTAWYLNIEQSGYLNPGNAQDGVYPGFPGDQPGYFNATGSGNGDWNAQKNTSYVMESDGTTKTLEQLANAGSGAWQNEVRTRAVNRFKILLEVCKRVSKAGSKVSAGYSAYQGHPRTDYKTATNVWFDGTGNVTHVAGGNSSNILTTQLNGQTVQIDMNGTVFQSEDIMLGYWYRRDFDMSYNDAHDIFDLHKDGTQNYQYLWSKITPIHVVAQEKGYIQLNRRLMQLRTGRKYPFVRLVETRYEGGYVFSINRSVRCPFPEVQDQIRYNNPNIRDTPGVWFPPYVKSSEYIVNRFFAGDEPGWGIITFPEEPSEITADKSQIGYYNFLMHPITAVIKARADMQPYEKFFVGSTLVEDPEVQLNGVGSFTAYDGTDANNTSDHEDDPKPAYMLRYNLSGGGYRVLIMGGMRQDYTTERTDIVRAASGGPLAGNRFKIKLRGPGAHVYEFYIKPGEVNQLYEATPVISPSFEIPAYSGRVTNDASTIPIIPGSPTGPGSGTTTPAPTPDNPSTDPTPTPSNTTGLYPDNFNFVSYPATDQSADNYWPTFETSKIKAIVGVQQQSGPTTGKGSGGDVVKLYDKVHESGVTWPAYPFTKNDLTGGQLVSDSDYSIPFGNFRIRGGYGIGQSLYLNPKPYYGFSELGWSGPGPGYNGLGYNPLGQDDGGMSMKVLHYGRQSTSYNVRTLPLLYSDYLAYAYPCTFEYWHFFEENVWTTYFKFTNNRTGASGPGGLDKAYHPLMDYISDQPQEAPCVYTNAYGGRTVICWYDGNSPHTNDASIRAVDVGGHSGFRQNSHFATENWCAIRATNGNALGLISREPRFSIGFFGSGNLDADFLKPNMLVTYINNTLNMMLDNQGTYYLRYRFVLGTIAEIRAEAYKTGNRPAATPQYRFNIPSRQGWSYGTFGDGATLGAPMEKRVWDSGVYAIGTDGVWNLKIGKSPYSVLESPAVAWKASDVQHIYFRYKYNGTRTTWNLSFVRNKQRKGSAASAGWEATEEGGRFDSGVSGSQNQTFSIVADNQWHVADINLSANSEWNNSGQQYIQKVTLQPNYTGVAPATADLAIEWISSISTGPPTP